MPAPPHLKVLQVVEPQRGGGAEGRALVLLVVVDLWGKMWEKAHAHT